jgi:hypothetical protein
MTLVSCAPWQEQYIAYVVFVLALQQLYATERAAGYRQGSNVFFADGVSWWSGAVAWQPYGRKDPCGGA